MNWVRQSLDFVFLEYVVFWAICLIKSVLVNCVNVFKILFLAWQLSVSDLCEGTVK